MEKESDVEAKVTAALMCIDRQPVDLPGRSHAASLTTQLRRLEVGGSAFVGREVKPTDTEAEGGLDRIRELLRQSVKSSYRNAGSEGNKYSIESMTSVSQSGRVFVMVVITRTA